MTELEAAWSCLVCEAHGAGNGSDRAAARHTKDERHSTRSWSSPRST